MAIQAAAFSATVSTLTGDFTDPAAHRFGIFFYDNVFSLLGEVVASSVTRVTTTSTDDTVRVVATRTAAVNETVAAVALAYHYNDGTSETSSGLALQTFGVITLLAGDSLQVTYDIVVA